MESERVGGSAPRIEPDEALAALADAQQARQGIADQAASPRGYYTVLGVGYFLICLGAAGDGWWRSVFLLGAAVCVADMLWYQRRTGVYVMSNFREPGVWRMYVVMAVFFVALVLSWATSNLWVGAAGGLVTGVVTAALGPAWDRAFGRALAAGR